MPTMFGHYDVFWSTLARQPLSNERVVDVLIHSTSPYDKNSAQVEQCESAKKLTESALVCRLPKDIADKVYEACESRLYSGNPVFRQYGQLYSVASFGRQGHAAWDDDGIITKFVSLSQLIHPTTVGFANTARLYFDRDTNLTEIVPGPCRGITEQAYVLDTDRNWISREEAELLVALFDVDIRMLPERLRRANWFVQHAAYQYFFEVKSLLIVSGLEALFNVDGFRQKGPKAKFCRCSCHLSRLLGTDFSDEEASLVYDYRSSVAHGKDPWRARHSSGAPPSEDNPGSHVAVAAVMKADKMLRTSVIKALQDHTFAELFNDEVSLVREFKLEVDAKL